MSVRVWAEGVTGTIASSVADGRDQVVVFSLRPLLQCCVTWAAHEAEAVGMSGDRQQWGHIEKQENIIEDKVNLTVFLMCFVELESISV